MTKKEYIERYGEEAYKRYLEKCKKYSRQYYQQYKEEIRELNKQYREQHKEEIRELNKQYKEQHREEIKEYNKQYMRKYNSMFAFCIPGEWEQIENYEAAKKDNFNGWQIHHRLETHNSDGERRLTSISKEELIGLDMYYNRPANELIFLTKAEHTKLHWNYRR
jgi:hypothetical protein